MTEGQFRAGVLETLAGIRGAIDALTAALAPPVAAEPPATEPALGECQHPEDMRTNFGGMGNTEDWQCRLCGHRQNGNADV